MPTYEYRCPQGHDFEKFFSRISEAAGTLPCPTCGQEAERRISGGAGLLFKGSGFYLTDYGKNAHRKAAPESSGRKDAGAEGAGKGESAKGESTKSESPKGGSTKGDSGGPSEKSTGGGESRKSSGTSSGGGGEK